MTTAGEGGIPVSQRRVIYQGVQFHEDTGHCMECGRGLLGPTQDEDHDVIIQATWTGTGEHLRGIVLYVQGLGTDEATVAPETLDYIATRVGASIERFGVLGWNAPTDNYPWLTAQMGWMPEGQSDAPRPAPEDPS